MKENDVRRFVEMYDHYYDQVSEETGYELFQFMNLRHDTAGKEKSQPSDWRINKKWWTI